VAVKELIRVIERVGCTAAVARGRGAALLVAIIVHWGCGGGGGVFGQVI